MRRLLSTAVSTLTLAACIVIGTSSPAAAESAPGCGDVPQIGETAYITTPSGQTAASVKQFAGCGKNWAYVYVWKSFRDTWGSWKVSTAIQTSSQLLGTRSSTGSEVWSEGTNTLSVCTRAFGQIWYGNPQRDPSARTDNRC
ncbi:hypothetical protein STRCI_002377 [Streptomyces cinnabarinus]|uniref:Secreted protein n=1 Tax=Streptomyces cinnabarinus TaxID=67287 RepID=A0ABY7KDJ3_9ACTN|nr:hypothetical protein [Streptomyces cinnabarinus]WAZ21217.1 hypothetical protein STRCI_002377 [Streptomyces cinnabarinus]